MPVQPGFRQPSVRAICFDLDDTLWDFLPVIQRAERTLRAHLEAHHPELLGLMSSEWMQQARDRMLEQYPHMAHDFTFLRRQGLRELALQAGHPEDVGDRAFEVFFAERNRLIPFDDVVPALERLKPAFRLASMTNGTSDLQTIGLSHFFEVSVAARDVGVLKPAAAMYTRILQALELSAAEVLHVGDDPWLDVEAPRQLGMPAVWVDRRGGSWPDSLPPPQYRVRSLGELAELLLGTP